MHKFNRGQSRNRELIVQRRPEIHRKRIEEEGFQLWLLTNGFHQKEREEG